MENADRSFNSLVLYLRNNRGFDFTGYKRGSLERRIHKRMEAAGVDDYLEYIDYLEVHPDEFTHLFNTILINVTDFFRDPEAWEYLAEEVIPDILSRKRNSEPVRVWATGCATGQEAYSIAILLLEALGVEEFSDRVKIFATDVDEDALTVARLAAFSEKAVGNISEDLLEKYFVIKGGTYSFRDDLRRNLIFGRNNLTQDAPISRVDLLICRNTLMYFNSETQGRILARFHFALNEQGYLFLGKAETLLTQSHLFTSPNLKMRVFQKVPTTNLRGRLLKMAQSPDTAEMNHYMGTMQVRDAVFEEGPVPQFVLDLDNTLLMVNKRARDLLKITVLDVGKPFQDLDISYHPVELRSPIQRVLNERMPVVIRDMEWQSGGGIVEYYDVRIQPLTSNGDTLIGISVTFLDVSTHKELEQKLIIANQELETALEEVQSTNEELETTNEELQSTIEEIETTNEELQSTNEELETMNEELQSTNQELQAINDELREKTLEMERLNIFLEAIFKSVTFGMVVLDENLRVLVWNHQMEDLWGIRTDEALHHNFLTMDIGLPVDALQRPVLDCLQSVDEKREMFLDARDRRGKSIQCRVIATPFINRDNIIQGVVLMMEKASEQGSHPVP